MYKRIHIIRKVICRGRFAYSVSLDNLISLSLLPAEKVQSYTSDDYWKRIFPMNPNDRLSVGLS